jgi:hypothetical protein
MLKPGSRLKSATCDTEVMVIRCDADAIECGGVPMGEARPADPVAMDPAHAAGTLTGKRYINSDGTCELLCVKAGRGSLSIGGHALAVKEAKPLPASD